MKKFSTISAAFLVISLGFASQAMAAKTSMQMKYKISGMMCAACASFVETALNDMKGIRTVKVDSSKGFAIIEAEEGADISSKAFKQALKEKGNFSAQFVSVVTDKKTQ